MRGCLSMPAAAMCENGMFAAFWSLGTPQPPVVPVGQDRSWGQPRSWKFTEGNPGSKRTTDEVNKNVQFFVSPSLSQAILKEVRFHLERVLLGEYG